jgi:hypothetical protein
MVYEETTHAVPKEPILGALCRIPARPFDDIVKAGHRPTKLNKIRQDSEELSHEKS